MLGRFPSEKRIISTIDLVENISKGNYEEFEGGPGPHTHFNWEENLLNFLSKIYDYVASDSIFPENLRVTTKV